MATINYRTANVDIYDPESSLNFPLATLQPASLPPPTSAAAAASTAQHVRQLLRSGDNAGALAAVLDSAPLGGDDAAKQVHLTTVIDVLQGIRQSDVPKVLESVLGGQGGRERGDTLMKYLYRGMSAPGGSKAGGGGGGAGGVSPQITGPGGGFSQIQARNLGEAGAGSGQAMSVLLSWHEKLTEIVGVGGIVRVMCDRRTV
jgi:actin related protein 2/3 complex, subunit 5